MPWPFGQLSAKAPHMSKLLDIFEQVSQGSPQPLGFGRKVESPKKPPLLLIANVATEADAKLVNESKIDAAILMDIATKAHVAKLSKTLGDTPWGVIQDGPKSQKIKGSDFVIFMSESTLVSSLNIDDHASIMKVDSKMDDSFLRTIEDIPIDCFLITLNAEKDLDIADLIQIARVRGVTTKWILVHLKTVPEKAVLEALKDLGVNAIVIDLEDMNTKKINDAYDILLSVSDSSSQKRNDRKNPKVPSIGIPGGFSVSQETEDFPDEFEDDDD